MNKFDYKNLTPFKWFVLENFPFIEVDFDALTEWHLFCKLGKEINKIIDSQNIVGEQAENLTNAFNNLKNYVDNYFDNLDVQDEINNKLNEMAESGELTDIIAQYLQLAGVLAYDTKTAMKNAKNLTNGSICKTLGNTTYNDGQGNFYKVREIINTDVVDDDNIIALHDENLVAEKIPYSSGYAIQQQINTINSNVDLINSERTILIGDSYSLDRRPDVDITGWAIPLKNLMGLNDTNCFIAQDNGGGFTVNGSLGTFENAISRLVIEDKSKIKNIIVAGGLNDIKAENKETIKTAIQSFMNYCKTNFPNAKVYIGMIGWNKDDLYTSDNQFIRYQVINKVLPAYQECNQYGAIYLNGVENVMHDYDEYYDGAHPNQTMCNRLAYYIYQAFKNGYASVTYDDHGITFNEDNIELNDFSLTEKVVNNQTIIFDNKENGNKILFNSNYPVVNTYGFYIGKINSKYMSSTYTNNQIVTCPAIITDTNNGKYQAVVSLYIKTFNFLHCHIVSGDIADGLSIKEINLLNPYCSKPTIMQ